MLTIFSTPKPFDGHIGMIQHNALKSWKLLHPDVEVILFGDEPGTAEVCGELGLRHVPEVERTAEGTKLVRSIFGPAQQLARHDTLCYSNCDIIFGEDFLHAIQRVSAWTRQFLMVAAAGTPTSPRRLTSRIRVGKKGCERFVLREGVQRLYYNIDYFAFPKGIYTEIPPLAIGRVWWDHWLIWKASQQKAAVIDASDVVMAMHQNHDYGYHPEGSKGVWYGAGCPAEFQACRGISALAHTGRREFPDDREILRAPALLLAGPGAARNPPRG